MQPIVQDLHYIVIKQNDVPISMKLPNISVPKLERMPSQCRAYTLSCGSPDENSNILGVYSYGDSAEVDDGMFMFIYRLCQKMNMYFNQKCTTKTCANFFYTKKSKTRNHK